MKKKIVISVILFLFCLTNVFSSILVADLDMIASFIIESIEEAERWTQKIQQWKIQYENIKQHAMEIKAQMERWKNVNITDLNSFKNFLIGVRGTFARMQNLEKEIARGTTVCLQFASACVQEINILEQSYYDGMQKIYEEHDFKNPDARWGGSLAEGLADELAGYETYKNAWQGKVTEIQEYGEETKKTALLIKEDLYPLRVIAKRELLAQLDDVEEKIHSTSGESGVSAEERDTYLAQIESLKEQIDRNNREMEKLIETYKKQSELVEEYEYLLQTAKDKVEEMDEQIRLFNENERDKEEMRQKYQN